MQPDFRPWLEALGTLCLAGAGVGLGFWFSRFRKPRWLLGYALPLLGIVACGLAAHIPSLSFLPPENLDLHYGGSDGPR